MRKEKTHPVAKPSAPIDPFAFGFRTLLEGEQGKESPLSAIQWLVEFLGTESSTPSNPASAMVALLGVLNESADNLWLLEYAFNHALTLTPEFKAFKADYIKRVLPTLLDDESEVKP